jgi:hypothetical protein
VEYSRWAQYNRILTDHLIGGIQRCWNSDSREGVRYQLPSDVAKLSFFITLCLDDEDFDDGGDTDQNKGNGGEVVREIPLHMINSVVLAKIVKYMEYYKQDPSEFLPLFVRDNNTDIEHWNACLRDDDVIVF